MIRHRSYMALAAGLVLASAAAMEPDAGVKVRDKPSAPPKPRQRLTWPYKGYQPPVPSTELVAERLRAAEAKRARKAARLSKGFS